MADLEPESSEQKSEFSETQPHDPDPLAPSEDGAGKSETGSKSNPIVRIVLLVVLVLGVILLVIDRRGRSGAQAFYDELEKTQEEEKSLTDRDVQELAGREPDAAYNHKTMRQLYVEEYKWIGAGRSYRVYCYYQSAADKFLDSISLNDPIDNLTE